MDQETTPWTKFVQKGNESQPSGQQTSTKPGSRLDSKVGDPDYPVPSQSLNSNTIRIKGDNQIEHMLKYKICYLLAPQGALKSIMHHTAEVEEEGLRRNMFYFYKI